MNTGLDKECVLYCLCWSLVDNRYTEWQVMPSDLVKHRSLQRLEVCVFVS